MKTTLILCLLFTNFALSQTKVPEKTPEKKETRDEGDKQLLKRDTCRKPIEALASKYPDLSQKQLEKMKQECEY